MNDEPLNVLRGRNDLIVIADNVSPNSRVLDLGCGGGELLRYLHDTKGVRGSGIELSQDKILKCVKIGVSVVHGNLNDGLGEFPDKSFDFVILSQTLQAVDRPDRLLLDMARVGRKVIVSFINIGYFTCRAQLLFFGRMPVTCTLPDPWYDTSNIHLGTLWDFRSLCRFVGIRIFKEVPLNTRSRFLGTIWPNMFAQTCVFIIGEKKTT